jgi:mono/diheme cytochrome c family protein
MRVIRLIGAFLAVVVVLVVLLVGAVYLNGQRQLTLRYDNPVPNVTVAASPERIERGRYLVSTFAECAGCHSTNPTGNPPVLDGNHMADLAALGQFYAPNLTPARLREWSDGEIVRAIREGVSRDGRGLFIMPSENFRHISDEDVQAIVAFLRQMPAVQKETPPIAPSFLGSMLLGASQVGSTRQPPVRSVSAPPRGATAEYGQYLVNIGGCRSCHGANLDGENIPQGPPPGPTLRVVKGWTEQQFVQTLRTGTNPSGKQLNPEQMPWPAFGAGTDEDIRAVYLYLRGLP